MIDLLIDWDKTNVVVLLQPSSPERIEQNKRENLNNQKISELEKYFKIV